MIQYTVFLNTLNSYSLLQFSKKENTFIYVIICPFFDTSFYVSKFLFYVLFLEKLLLRAIKGKFAGDEVPQIMFF
jgi:hypothetical protein